MNKKTLKYLKYAFTVGISSFQAFTGYSMQAQAIVNDTLSRVGYAYSQDDPNELVFIERSRYVIKDNEIVWSQSSFYRDNEVFATKLYIYNKNKVEYFYKSKPGYNETVDKTGTTYTCYITEATGEKTSKKSFVNPADLRFDEGVISTILKNKAALISGKKVPIKILVAERADYFEFVLELEKKNSEDTFTYTLYPSNFLLKAFVPDFFFTLKNGQIKEVIGMSKVGRQLGTSEVIIKF